MLLLGTCLATPYLQDYDLVFGALVVVWLAQDQDAAHAGMGLVLGSASLLLLPLFAAPLALVTGLAFGPLFILPLFVIALKCGLAKRQSTALTAVAEILRAGSKRVMWASAAFIQASSGDSRNAPFDAVLGFQEAPVGGYTALLSAQAGQT